MVREASVEIVSSSFSNNSSGESDRDGPARLMKPDDTTDLNTKDYPEVTAHVNIESSNGTVEDVDQKYFDVEEDGSARDIVSFDYINDALDLVFVFDDTGSMGAEIDGAKAGVTDLTDSIDNTDVDARYALVSFKDDVEVDQRFTKRARSLKSSVDKLVASAGGDAPEANFDAIERALDLNWRSDAQQVIVDITDATSHYRGDGSNFSDYTFDEVARDLQDAGVTFISIAKDYESKQDSLKSLASEVGGLWTDISQTRSGMFSSDTADNNFQDVLERITSLVASTYVLTYFSCTEPGTNSDVKITFDHPDYSPDNDTASVSVPNHFDLHPDCREGGDKVVSTEVEDNEEPGVEKLEPSDIDDDPSSVVNDEDKDTPKVERIEDATDEDKTDLAVIADDTVSAGSRLQVTVRDDTGSRVDNATVRVAGMEATTDSRGQCSFTMADPGVVTINVEKGSDYSSASKEITVE